MSERTVTARVVMAGDVEIHDPDGKADVDTLDALVKIERGVVVQFDHIDELRAAISGVADVRLEWNVAKEPAR